MTATAHISAHHDVSMADLAKLRAMRNAVIGSRTRKSEIVAQGKIPSLVALISSSTVGDEVRSLAATIVGSLAHAATPPTLLSLCRADATNALLVALEDLAKRMADSRSYTTASSAHDVQTTLTLHLKQLESYLRALRSILMALSDEVAPGTRWERGSTLSLTMGGTGSGASTPRFGTPGKSAREVIGWQMASAGFAGEYGDQARARLAKRSHGQDEADLITPHEELMLLARQSIADAFHPDRLQYWLGAFFIARLPVATKKVSQTRTTTHMQGRTSARAASPSVLQAVSANLGANTSRSSSISMGSDAVPDAATPSVSVSDNMSVASGLLNTSNQVRILAIVEMVSGMLSSGLAVACDAASTDEDDGSNACLTAEQSIAHRRKSLLAFKAINSAYWQANEADENVETISRGRHTRAPVISGTSGSGLQGAFVKRGKSIDGRGMDEEEQSNAMAHTSPHTEAERANRLPYVRASTGVLDVLLEAIECGYAKTQEAALWALTDLTRENKETIRSLFACYTPSGVIPTTMLLNLRKESSVTVRLAAFCCLSHIVKVHPFTPRTNRCILSVLVELMDVPGEVQITATLAFARLVADEGELQSMACEQYGCVEKLGAMLGKSKINITTTPDESSGNVATSNVDGTAVKLHDGLPERLREAALTALAALCFQRDEIRRKLVDLTTPSVLPLVVASMSIPQVGIRIAACRLVRALSRSISILRTSLVDAGVAPRLLSILQDDDEDAQVRNEAIASMCNLVLKFSPMKQMIIDGGGITKLVDLIKNSSDAMVRLNALWAVKNILYSSDTALKVQVMDALGWEYVRQLALAAMDVDIQEQALNIIRNVCNNREDDVEAALRGFGGGDSMLDLIEEVIWQRRGENTLVQAAFVLVNLTTGTDEHRKMIIGRPNLLDALVYFLNHPRAEIRVAGIWAATNLTQPLRVPVARTSTAGAQDVTLEAIARLKSFGFDKRLKELVEDPERDVSDRARGLMVRFDSLP